MHCIQFPVCISRSVGSVGREFITTEEEKEKEVARNGRKEGGEGRRRKEGGGGSALPAVSKALNTHALCVV